MPRDRADGPLALLAGLGGDAMLPWRMSLILCRARKLRTSARPSRKLRHSPERVAERARHDSGRRCGQRGANGPQSRRIPTNRYIAADLQNNRSHRRHNSRETMNNDDNKRRDKM